jgi:hypothetical protein
VLIPGYRLRSADPRMTRACQFPAVICIDVDELPSRMMPYPAPDAPTTQTATSAEIRTAKFPTQIRSCDHAVDAELCATLQELEYCQG